MPLSSSGSQISRPVILQVIPSLEAGGAERTTIEIAQALTQAGFLALVASQGGRLEGELAASGGELVRMPGNAKSPARIMANALALRERIRKRAVKLVHARSRAPAWSALFAARMARVPFVTTYHGIYNASHGFKRFYNSVMAKGDIVIANSQWTADHIRKEHKTDAARIAVIPRGVDLSRFDPHGVAPERVAALHASWGVPPGSTVVLLPGRLTRWKGQELLIEALTRLKQKGALSRVCAVLAGDAQGRAAYVRELQALATLRRLQDAISIPGHVSDMPAAYLAADIVVSASTDPEAFGRVAAEAGAMGRPVIATDHGGARETVVANTSGLLVPPGNADALATALGAMLALSPDERAAMGAKGRAHIAAHYSLESMCAATLAVYRKLLG